MPEENTQQNQNNPAPTWADFKPPVATTPFAQTPAPNPDPAMQATPTPTPASPFQPLQPFISSPTPPNPTSTEASSQSSASYPWMQSTTPVASSPEPVSPAVATPTPEPTIPIPAPVADLPPQPFPAVKEEVFPAPVEPEAVPTTTSNPAFTPMPTPPSFGPLSTPEAPVTPALPPTPQPVIDPALVTEAPKSFVQQAVSPTWTPTPTPTPPPIPDAAPATSWSPAPAPAPVITPPSTPIPEVSAPVIAPSPPPIVSDGYLAPQPASPTPAPVTAAMPTPAPKSGGSPLPWIAGGLVLAGVLVAAGYYIYTTRFAPPKATSSTLGAKTSNENLAILSSSPAPDSWESNYSTSLLAVERGGVEFMVTDPPSQVGTSSATPSAAVSDNTMQVLGISKADITSLTVKVAKVDVHLTTQSVVANGPSPDATKSASKQLDRWETLRLNDQNSVDLMQLRSSGGTLQSLGVTYLTAGHYSQIMVYITAATATLKDGTKVNLAITEQNGIVKINKAFDLSSSGTLKMVVDFDAPGSVVKDGSNYRFAPVVNKFLINNQPI